MASRAERKRRVRQLAQIRRGLEAYADELENPPRRRWQLSIDLGLMVETSRQVRDAFASLVAKMRELTLAARRAACVWRETPKYLRRPAPARLAARPQRRSAAFRLPRGGGRWSAR